MRQGKRDEVHALSIKLEEVSEQSRIAGGTFCKGFARPIRTTSGETSVWLVCRCGRVGYRSEPASRIVLYLSTPIYSYHRDTSVLDVLMV